MMRDPHTPERAEHRATFIALAFKGALEKEVVHERHERGTHPAGELCALCQYESYLRARHHA